MPKIIETSKRDSRAPLLSILVNCFLFKDFYVNRLTKLVLAEFEHISCLLFFTHLQCRSMEFNSLVLLITNYAKYQTKEKYPNIIKQKDDFGKKNLKGDLGLL